MAILERSPNRRGQRLAKQSDPNKAVFTAELTLLEWSSTLARAFRRKTITRDDFKRNEVALMSDLVAEKLQVYLH